MARTPFAETEALLAVMEDDEDAALEILDDMLPGERRAFIAHLDRVSLLADDTQRCARCGKLVDALAGVTTSDLTRGGRQNWHRDCLAAQRAEAES